MLVGATSRDGLEAIMTMRSVLGGLALAAAIVALAPAARAADLPVPPPMKPAAPVAYAPQVYNWSGIYFGGHIGGGYSYSSWSDPLTGTANDTFNNLGFLGGAQLGGNIQFNRLVLGVEGDFSWLSGTGSGTDSGGETVSTNTQWTSTITGRIGAAFDRLLVYGKGGLALAGTQNSLTDLGGNTANSNLTRTGWTAGIGLEYALDDNWSAKIEYDYLDFGPQALNFTTPLESVSSNAGLDIHEVKAGLNYRFNGP
jgi:outer membrane immunogenic protein